MKRDGMENRSVVGFVLAHPADGLFFVPDLYKRQRLSWAYGEAKPEHYLADADAVVGSLGRADPVALSTRAG